jgi:hypothetical protein
MILTEYLNEGTLIKHYSDSGFMLLQNETGIKYSDPIDIVPCPYTYTETDEPIEIGEEEIIEEDAIVEDEIELTIEDKDDLSII